MLSSLLALLFVGVASAHPAAASALRLSVATDHLEGTLALPAAQLALARGTDDPAALGAYVAEHLAVRAPDGRAYRLETGPVTAVEVDSVPSVRVPLSLTPPEGAGTDHFVVAGDPVLHRVRSHKIYVTVERDFARGQVEEEAQLAGVLRLQTPAVDVDRGAGSRWRGASALLAFGMRHIAEGPDHLLFLLTLLLPLPALAAGGRWQGARGPRAVARAALGLVTAFAVAHATTLVLGTVGAVRLPERLVETGIALSILVGAVHVARPIFPRREAWVALVFGLIHGLAFAGSLADLGLRGADLAVGLVAFNLGIELAQIAVAAAVLPALLLIHAVGAFPAARTIGAALAGAVAVFWIGQRAVGGEAGWRAAEDAVPAVASAPCAGSACP